ncbi:MAG: hypothetical protein ACD_20C00089G0005 [uncultured bacterium]|nr:MAG: hypothetical protein ACD_20C00089G0005 [uncultured bacterium]HBH18556.1 hypothetical protein [Cyanobacteria bacterium UBA9579]
MSQFENGVPFDPGYSQYTLYFPEAILPLVEELARIKAPHQKKFKLSMVEPAIHDLVNNCAGFYLGCILWGGFIHHKFKDDPKEIINNPGDDLTEEELKSRDYNEEINFMLEYFKHLDRDYKYFCKKPFKVDQQILDIFNAYSEFVSLNNNFANIKLTSDVKLPESVKHFDKLSQKKLDTLYKNISEVIESGKLEDLLKIGFYK